MNLSGKVQLRSLRPGLILGIVLLAFLPLPAPGTETPTGGPIPGSTVLSGVTFVRLYRVVQQVGEYDQLKGNVPPGTELVKSSDGHTGYVMKSVPVNDADHLLRLMGAADESQLSDAQKGLLEAYRFTRSPKVREYRSVFPYKTATVTIELNDVNGFDERYPSVREDFWPTNSRTLWKVGEKITNAEFRVRMSAVNLRGWGNLIPERMKSTMIHELAHSLDLTQREMDGYGPDGTHFFNEVVKERSAFVEGFADFNQFSLNPGLVERYRTYLEEIRIEATGTYIQKAPTDPTLPGTDLLKVEGVIALTMFRLGSEISDGEKKVFAAFAATNSAKNTFPGFLNAFVRLHPETIALAAAILDQETHQRLTDDELRTVFGPSLGLEEYLATRPAATVRGTSAAAPHPVETADGEGEIIRTTTHHQTVQVGDDDRNPFADR